MEELRELKPEEYELWDKLVMESESGTIFHTTSWLKATGKDFIIYGYFMDDELFTGIPIVYSRSVLGLKTVDHPPITPYLGILFKQIQGKYTTILSTKKKVYSIVAERLKEDFDSVYIKFPPNFVDLQPFIWKGYSDSLSYTYLLNLKDMNEVWEGMSLERREDIKETEEEGIRVEVGEDFEDIFSLQVEAYKRLGKTIDFKDTALRYHKLLTDIGQCRMFIAKNVNDKIVAAAYIMWDSKSSYYIYGGYDYETSNYRTLATVIWESIKFTREEVKLNKFDFEGCAFPAIEKFLRGFGGRLTPYYRIKWENRRVKLYERYKRIKRKAMKLFRPK